MRSFTVTCIGLLLIPITLRIRAMNQIEAVQALIPVGVDYSNFLDGAGLLNIQPAGWSWSDELETLQSLMQTLVRFVRAADCALALLTARPGEHLPVGVSQLLLRSVSGQRVALPDWGACPLLRWTQPLLTRFVCYAGVPTAAAEDDVLRKRAAVRVRQPTLPLPALH